MSEITNTKQIELLMKLAKDGQLKLKALQLKKDRKEKIEKINNNNEKNS